MSTAEPQSPAAEPAASKPPRPWWQRLLLSKFLWTALAFVVAGILIYDWINDIGGPKVFRERYGLVAPLVSLPVHVILTIAPVPSDLICVANGALYGFWIGFFLSWLGWFIAGLIQYGIGRQMRSDFSLHENMERLPRRMQKLPIGHPLFLILVRQMPWAGSHMGSVLPGAVGIPWWRHTWCMSVAIIPGALLYAAIGYGILQL